MNAISYQYIDYGILIFDIERFILDIEREKSLEKGTQCFMDVAFGKPAQKFTVIFDTGSAVFCIFTQKEDLPASILNRLDSSTALKVQVGANALMV